MNDTSNTSNTSNTTVPVQTAAEAATGLLYAVTPEQVADAIKAAGCAVTTTGQDDNVQLHSASHGIGYQVLWGNRLASGQYIDFTLSCPLRVQGGTLPAGLLSEWHRTRRFARVAEHGDFVVLEMDVVISGGVGPEYLPVALQLWTQMMGQYFLHLRNFKPVHAAEGAAPELAPQPAAEAEAG
jgi:hypothetical protein